MQFALSTPRIYRTEGREEQIQRRSSEESKQNIKNQKRSKKKVKYPQIYS